MRQNWRLIIFTVFFLNTNLLAQNDFFTELTITKKIPKKENWNILISGTWKHTYNEIGWRRIELNGITEYNISSWNLFGGVYTGYTFDQEIINLMEIRPKLGIGLKTPIFKRLDFNQRFQSEWRNFTTRDSEIDKSSFRLRYRIGLQLRLSNSTNPNPWILRTDTEWYILYDKEIKERYINSREVNFQLTKKLNKNKEISLGYRNENFNPFLEISKTGKGNTIFLSYLF